MKTDWEIAQAVIEAVERAYGIPDITVWSRRRRIAKARHLACYIIREITDLSTTDVADLIGREDHTTVLNACRRVKGDPEALKFVPRIKADAEALLA